MRRNNGTDKQTLIMILTLGEKQQKHLATVGSGQDQVVDPKDHEGEGEVGIIIIMEEDIVKTTNGVRIIPEVHK